MDVIESPCRPKYMLPDKVAGVATTYCTLGLNTSELWGVKWRQWNCEHTYIWQDCWHQWEVKTVVPMEEIKNVEKGKTETIGSRERDRTHRQQPPLCCSPARSWKTEAGRDAPEWDQQDGKWLIVPPLSFNTAVYWGGQSVGITVPVVTKAGISHSLHYMQWASWLAREERL